MGNMTTRMKTILLILHDDPGQHARLRAAVDLAHALDGEIICLNVMRSPHLVRDYYSVAGRTMWSDEEAFAGRENRTCIERLLRDSNVRCLWREARGDIADCVLRAAELADIIVANSRLDADETSAQGIIGPILVHSRKPVLAMPGAADGMSFAGKALVAWDGSRAISETLRSAVPLLQLASSVRLHTITPGGDVASAREAAHYLSRHNVHAMLTSEHDAHHKVGALLRVAAATWNAAYCVMGAYGRSRLSEALFGGVTRSMLAKSEIPLLLGR